MTNEPRTAGAELRPDERPPHRSSEEVGGSIAQRFFDAAVDMLCVASVEGHLVQVSPSFAQTLGDASTQDVLSRPILDLVHPDDREATLEKLNDLRKGHVVFDFENRYLCADGSYRWLQWRCSPMQADGLVFSMARDVTSVVQVRALMEDLAQERRRFESILRGTTDLVSLADPEGRILFMNPAGRRMLGIDEREDITRFHLSDLHPPRSRGIISEVGIPEALREGTWSGEHAVLHTDGQEIPVSQVLIAHRDSAGELEFISIINRDLRERKALEEQLLHSQKLEGIGRLAGGVAHDFNNILTVILGNAEIAEANSPKDSPVSSGIRAIREAGERAAALTTQLLTFARRQITQPRVLDLNALVLGVDSMLRRTLGENIELAAESEPGLWPVEIDPGQLEQVLINLAVNANDAMPGGGRLTIATHNDALAAGAPGLPAGFAPGEYVELVVADTGVGMDEAVQRRAFEPFYTTKELGKGTGLGLSTCHGIVAQHGGHIELDSGPDRGTAVRILLPRAREAAREEQAEPRVGASRGTETVLLVEDEKLVCKLAAEVLRSLGYTVLAATTGEHALELAARHRDSIDILVTDVVLPKTSGKEVADRLQQELPSLTVLFTSGYTHSAVGAHGLGGPELNFLQKPYTPSELANRVRGVLDGLGEVSTGA